MVRTSGTIRRPRPKQDYEARIKQSNRNRAKAKWNGMDTGMIPVMRELFRNRPTLLTVLLLLPEKKSLSILLLHLPLI